MPDSHRRFLITFAGLSLLLAMGCSGPEADDTAAPESISVKEQEIREIKDESPEASPNGDMLGVTYDPAKLLWYDGTDVGEALSPNRLKKVRTISASSTLQSVNGRGYPIEQLRDGKPDTAWCEGVDGPGTGQTIRVRFEENQVPAGISIVPGYAKSPAVWKRNPRVRALRVVFLDCAVASQEAEGVCEPRYTLEFFFRLKERDGHIPYAQAQYVDFRPPWTQDMSIIDYDGLELTILEVEDAGAADADACISELQFYDW